jgi:ABC-type transport system involved in multi-copper enzyme maturation permease subunit
MLAKELAEMAQRRRTYTVRVWFAALIFLMSALVFLPTYRAAQHSPVGLSGQGARLLCVLYEVEWFGLCLFVPAIVSGALAAEKERNTLQLLFLTRLGPWTILIEKLLSRFVPVGTFLLVSLPLIFVAYLLGGLTRADLEFAALGLVVTAFEVGCIALFCSAYCATSASAFVMSYLLLAFVYLFPIFVVLGILLVDHLVLVPLGHSPILFGQPGTPRQAFWLNSTQGITDWIFYPASSLSRPFHTTLAPLLVLAAIGLGFLVLARLAIVRRSAPQPKHRIRRLFRRLDQTFQRLNDRYANGILLIPLPNDLPEDNPIAWREKRRGNLGRINYLVRMLLVIEVPIFILTSLLSMTSVNSNFGPVRAISMLLWPIALLVVMGRAAGLIAAEKARQTLDVLLTTPLPLAAILVEKMRGLRRVMLAVSVPIVCQAVFIAWLDATAMRNSMVTFHSGRQFDLRLYTNFGLGIYVAVVVANLVILLGLAAQLAFRFGLAAKTQGRAMMLALAVFVAWSFAPLLIYVFGGWGGNATLFLSPIASILVNENPGFDLHSQGTGVLEFSGLLHCVIYATLLAALTATNRRAAAKALLRPIAALGPVHL